MNKPVTNIRKSHQLALKFILQHDSTFILRNDYFITGVAYKKRIKRKREYFIGSEKIKLLSPRSPDDFKVSKDKSCVRDNEGLTDF